MLQTIRNCIIGPFEFSWRQVGWVELAGWTKKILPEFSLFLSPVVCGPQHEVAVYV
jgi:hypothetical protein